MDVRLPALGALVLTPLTTNIGGFIGLIYRHLTCPYVVDDATITAQRNIDGHFASDNVVRYHAEINRDNSCGLQMASADGAVIGLVSGLAASATFLISYAAIQCNKRKSYRLAEDSSSLSKPADSPEQESGLKSGLKTN